MRQTYDILATVPPGLEFVLAAELTELLDRPVREVPGGVLVQGDLVDAAGLVLWSRVAARVLVQLAEVPAASLQQLEVEARRVPWERLVHRGQRVEVRASVKEARFRRTDAVTHKIDTAIKDRLRANRGQGYKLPPAEVAVRVAGKTATLSLDAGSGLLHRRGYRLATAKAPLRENLAAAVLVAAGWQPGVPLVDPVCGSGTFLIEAACQAADVAPGLDRHPGIVDAPDFPKGEWARMVAEARAERRPVEGVLLGGDRDPGALRAARSNAERAGVLDALTLVHKPLEEPFPTPVTGPGLVVMNPPYGVRVAENVKLAPVYQRFGQALAAQFPGWRLAAVLPDKALAGRLARKPEELTRFENGGIPVSLWIGEL